MNRGLTLIELVISLTIVAVLFAATVLGVGSLIGTQAKSELNEIAGVIRSLYETAALGGKTCRLVFHFPDERPSNPESKAAAVRYWAECAQGNVAAGPDQSPPDDHRAQDDRRSDRQEGGLAELTLREKQRIEAPSTFSAFTSPEVKPKALSRSVRLKVWTARRGLTEKSGVAYLYFFPQGFTERAMILLEQGSNAWTLSVSPLTGKTSVVGEALEIPRS